MTATGVKCSQHLPESVCWCSAPRGNRLEGGFQRAQRLSDAKERDTNSPTAGAGYKQGHPAKAQMIGLPDRQA